MLVHRQLLDPHLDALHPPHQEVLEGGLGVVRVADGDVDQAVELIAHGRQGEGEPGRLGGHQVAKAGAGGVTLLFGEAGPLHEVDDGGGDVAKLLAGVAGGLDVLAPQVRIAQQKLSRIAAHKGHVQPPAGEPQQRDVDELVLHEELGHRQPVAEEMAQHDDVGPAQVVADDEIPAILA